MKVNYPKPLNSPATPAIRFASLIETALSPHARGMEAASRHARTHYQIEGLRLLCKYYGIDWTGPTDDVFFELAFRLAQDNVPYFRVRKARLKAWDEQAQAKLLLDVLDIQERARKYPRRFPGQQTVRGACEALYAAGKYKQKGLEQRYKEARRDLLASYSRKRLGIDAWREMLVALAGQTSKKEA